jgi:hypothetical protein
MKRLLLLAAAIAATLTLAPSALAVAPALTAASVDANRHPSITFAAPAADSVTVFFAKEPGQASNGQFFSENVERSDFLTDDEIQTGAWTFEYQLDPGTYYVLLKASPIFSQCYISGGTYRPECANGYSNVGQIVVPMPPIKYSAIVSAPKYTSSVQLKTKASVLGINQGYRVCFRNRTKKTICVHGTLNGYSWNSKASDYLTISKTNLPGRATLKWYVGNTKVVEKSFLVRRPD